MKTITLWVRGQPPPPPPETKAELALQSRLPQGVGETGPVTLTIISEYIMLPDETRDSLYGSYFSLNFFLHILFHMDGPIVSQTLFMFY